MPATSMDQLVSLCKRRGFIFQNADIYGGLQGVYDYGPLGVELKNNLKAAWWRAMVYERDDVEGLDAAILTNQKVLHYSGHEDTFSDPMTDCRKCKGRFRADHIKDGKCPNCGSTDLTEPRPFNLMFKTAIGPVDDGSSFGYLRPETAQAIFTQFKNVVDATSRKLPFGIAQIGKAFRNEIVARQFIFRMREFEQMEMQFFVRPGEEMRWWAEWRDTRMKWHRALGFGADNYRFHDHDKLAHYANAATDIEYNFPFGFKEVEGIHSRTDFDLSNHQKFSGKKIQYFDSETGESYVPYVVETSIGVDRMFLQVMSAAYTEEKLENGEERVVLRIPAALAPTKVAVLPLVKKDGMPEVAQRIVDLLKYDFNVVYDEKDSVGKRYRRQDAIGTPLCVTVDGQTLEDNTVTVRHRDTMQQERVAIDALFGLVDAECSLRSLLKKLNV